MHDLAVKALKSVKNSMYFDFKRVFIDPKTLKEYGCSNGLRKYVWLSALRNAGVEYRYP